MIVTTATAAMVVWKVLKMVAVETVFSTVIRAAYEKKLKGIYIPAFIAAVVIGITMVS